MLRRVVETLDLPSVVRMTVAVCLALWGIAFVTILALYVLGLVSGGLGGAEGLIASFGFSGFRFTLLPFVVAFLALALLFSVVVGGVAAIVCLVYNALVPIFGGVEVRTKDLR